MISKAFARRHSPLVSAATFSRGTGGRKKDRRHRSTINYNRLIDCDTPCTARLRAVIAAAFVVYATERRTGKAVTRTRRLNQESISDGSRKEKNSITGGRPGYFLSCLICAYTPARAVDTSMRRIYAAIMAASRALRRGRVFCYAKFAWALGGILIALQNLPRKLTFLKNK